ncbi:MAG: hypothetical protein JWR08_426 [Enterovirga sp.]|nr:hypothetical protein [Enterovirga sp.]
MIYCVAFHDVDRHLQNLGFKFAEQVGSTLIYVRDEQTFTIHAPNQTGGIPEIIVDDTFANPRLLAPDVRSLFWCD